MFELVQTLWAVFQVALPVALFIGAGIMVWNARGLPVNESMEYLRTLDEVVRHDRDRTDKLEQRADATDDHLRALGCDVQPVGKVVVLRKGGR